MARQAANWRRKIALRNNKKHRRACNGIVAAASVCSTRRLAPGQNFLLMHSLLFKHYGLFKYCGLFKEDDRWSIRCRHWLP